MSDTSTPLPHHWETGQPFDWRDYVEIESDVFPEHRLAQITTSLDRMAKTPEGQEWMQRLQADHIMATWQKIHDFCAEEAKASPPDSEIGKKLFDRYFERDPRKILLTDDSLLGRSSFNAVFRILPLNFEQIESHSYVVQQDTSGLIPPPVELHPMDLVHVDFHELKHAGDINTYNYQLAILQVGKQIDLTSTDPLRDEAHFESMQKGFEESVLEPYVINSTNEVMFRHFNAPKRDGHIGQKSEQPHTDIVPEITTNEIAFPLPILSQAEQRHREISVEEIVDLLTPAAPGASKQPSKGYHVSDISDIAWPTVPVVDKATLVRLRADFGAPDTSECAVDFPSHLPKKTNPQAKPSNSKPVRQY